MNRIFQLRHFEIFLILFLIPIMMGYNIPFLSRYMHNPMILALIITLIQVGLIEFWFYSIAKKFNSKFINKKLINFYNLNLIIVFIKFLIVGPLMLYSFGNFPDNSSKIFHVVSIISNYLNFYIYFSLFYTLIIAAKILISYELDNEAKFSDYYQTALLFIVLPISIFWIQPRIQKLLNIQVTINKKRQIILISLAIIFFIAIMINISTNSLKSDKGPKIEDYVSSLMSKKYKAECDSINSVISNDSLNAKHYFNRSLIYYKYGLYRKSIIDITKAISIDSLNTEYYYNKGVILFQNFNQIDSAIKEMSVCIKLNKKDWRPFQNRGYYRYLNKDYDLALQDINKGIKLNSKYSGSYLIRGYLKELKNDMIGACKDWTLADSLGNKDASFELKFKCKKTN